MRIVSGKPYIVAVLMCGLAQQATAGEGVLPTGVKAVWGLAKAQRESTETRERVCINGLWRWQPAREGADGVPNAGWGYFKVPGCWPGITNYMQKDSQTVHVHPSWKDQSLRGVTTAWYQREITVPREWANRRIVLYAEYVNSFATVYIDGKKVGEIRFPRGEVELTAACQPGDTHVLSMLVVAMPLKGVMLSYNDTASARKVKGSVARRGLCGDVYLASMPPGPRITDVKIDTSVPKWAITFDVALESLADDAKYVLKADVVDGDRTVQELTSQPFQRDALKGGRFTFAERWKPEKLWDVHTPQNMYRLDLSLREAGGKVLDASLPVRFGFREFWIEGRDFKLNGTRIYLSSVPIDNAQVGAALSTYDAARESMERLQSFGINYVYAHNYGCQPGSHLSFEEILRAADDVGMLIGLSQPHFGHYDWDSPNADQENGYARHAEFYVRVAQNHPSVVAYATSHNATGYAEDMNPHMIDGIQARRSQWSANNVRRAKRAEAIIKRLDSSRVVYHHASGNLGPMHTSNFYANFVPIQEMSDWFEHWATNGVKPLFTCEYSVPMPWDWAMYRGWYKGRRAFGSAQVPWEFCVAEWNAQFFGDRAYQISEEEKVNLRWEAQQYRAGRLWHRWDYRHRVGHRTLKERYPVYEMYFSDNWPAFRTWGVSANSPWNHGHYWTLRDGVDKGRQELKTDWENLQRPGFSPDYIEGRFEKIELAFERSDWIPTVAAKALIRNNGPVLAYIAGKLTALTSKDHNFYPGEVVEKQIMLPNNSRETVTCDCEWTFGLPESIPGRKQLVIRTGERERLPLRFELPDGLAAGTCKLSVSARFSTGQTHQDSFSIDVLPRPPAPHVGAKVALYDPKGETSKLLDGMGIQYRKVDAEADLSAYEVLIVGKGALTVGGPAPNVMRVRDGLKVLVFEQTPEALEQRFGFRVAAYGLRRVFNRIPDHPALAGLAEEHLRNWRGEATILSPRLEYKLDPKFNYTPTVRWCGIPVTRLWRCGNRGNVASALIEKPARGDFRPILDGGYSLQYSPLMEYREGQGMVLFCQMDVTGRTESDPAAETLTRNLLEHVSTWKPAPRRQAVYVGDPAGKRHLESAGIALKPYEGGALGTDEVLVVGAGGGRELARNAAAIAEWIEKGGHVLALGLDEQDARAFLPMKVSFEKKEHIAAYFEPFGADSLLAGVAPADVHNPAPRALPLVSGGATAIGNGVLGRANDANVVLCQIPPYIVSKSQGALPSLAASTEDAVDGKQSALLTMGTAAWGQFGQKLKAGSVGKTYTFAVSVKALDEPVRARLEVERAASPWDRAVRGKDIQFGTNEWTELHVTFRVTKAYPQGWSAYIYCAQEGARFLADQFRLSEGSYVPAKREAKNLFKNPSFEAGVDPWWFSYRTEQHNLKRTYRHTSFLLARLLANMGVAGSTPLLEHFSTPVGGTAGDSIVRNGDFRADANGDAMPDEWLLSATTGSSGKRERMAEGDEAWSLALVCPPAEGDKKPTLMLAQHEVSVKKGQWYRFSFKARAEGLAAKSVTVTVMNCANWRPFFQYQYFKPSSEWERFSFEVQSNDGAEQRTRFQIWYVDAGKLWLSDVRVQPITDPTEGRWLEGLYLDVPEEWDDPYRFFRW